MKQSLKFSSFIFTLLLAFILLLSTSSCTSENGTDITATTKTTAYCPRAMDLKCEMRKLWEDHITWTRNVIFCLVDDLPGKDEAIERLLENQLEIGDVFKPFAGEDCGRELSELLFPHVTISAEVIKALKSGDKQTLASANQRWYANADEIAVFFSKMNGKWEVSEMKMMMRKHLQLTTREAQQRINKDYPADVLAYEALHTDILMMADMLSEGIIEQYPLKFENEKIKLTKY